ncbi:hypothetical protein B0H16DRAFT_1474330 [Mycena metata]|uniref:Uncharacterized protein n=1 Tax=Mycena metata TaxID=1033252 RepID=A0AAD7HI02_9AGAR|nr:hypothetical protein B0H16DRAFT_1474330 [Mycena metata]
MHDRDTTAESLLMRDLESNSPLDPEHGEKSGGFPALVENVISPRDDLAAHYSAKRVAIAPIAHQVGATLTSNPRAFPAPPLVHCAKRCTSIATHQFYGNSAIPVSSPPPMHDRDTTAESLLMRDLESNRSLSPTLAPPEGKGATPSQWAAWAPLQSSASIVFFVLCYAAMAVIAWTATCYLSFKPIGAKHYGVNVLYMQNNGYGDIGPQAYHQLYVQSEEWFRAARVLASIFATLTIPVATAVCTRAAVAFHQRKRLTLRQTMMLADKAWIEPVTWLRLLIVDGRRSIASSFLIAAIFLNLLGAIIAPLQQLFLSTATIKTPIWPVDISQVDIMDHFNSQEPSYDFSDTTALIRDRLASTGTTTPQAQLWSRNTTCDSLLTEANCLIPDTHYTFGNISQLEDPFFTQLPLGFSTGLIRQFAPRINSTARRENITQEQFPQGCDTLPGAFYVKYENVSTLNTFPGFTFEACMPANVSASPWKATRDRQDFSEVLYLAVNLTTAGGWEVQVSLGTFFARITVNTSAGFFELPNYMNGGIPGPLLAEDPTVRAPGKCDVDCEPQTFLENISRRAIPNTNSKQAVFNETYNLQYNVNKGPLLQNALALFGFGSFIDAGWSPSFLPLLRSEFGQDEIGNPVDGCSRLPDSEPANSAQLEIIYYLSSFVSNTDDAFPGERIANAFSAAAFLANQAWMLSVVEGHLFLNYDLGADMQVPVLSLRGIIVVSVVLGLFLLALLGMALYAWRTPTWTTTLDAFAMLRIGAAVGAPLRPAHNSDEAENERWLLFPRNGAVGVAALDQSPGWVGDALHAEGAEAVGQLALGTGSKSLLGKLCPYLPATVHPVRWSCAVSARGRNFRLKPNAKRRVLTQYEARGRRKSLWWDRRRAKLSKTLKASGAVWRPNTITGFDGSRDSIPSAAC